MKIIRNIEGRSHLTASQVRARARVVMLTSRSATAVSPAFFSARAGRPPARRVAMASSATSSPAPTIRLSSGTDMPLVGLGTWQAPRGVVGAAVADALRLGYRHIDCAAAYANETEVGAALREAFANGTATRDGVFVTSKLWNDRRRPEDVRDACAQTLEDLRLEYVDLYLIHWPVCWKRGTLMQDDERASIAECWRAMEGLVRDGKARAIGVSNFSEPELAALLSACSIAPAVNQIELHPRLPQKELVSYCQSRNIAVTAYSPLARGSGVLDHPAMGEIAARRGVSAAQAALRWNVERNVAVIPKSVTPSRIAANADVFAFEWDERDSKAVARVEDGVSTATSPWSTSGPIGARNRWIKPVIQLLLWPVFLVARVDVQKMGRKGFLSWAWSAKK